MKTFEQNLIEQLQNIDKYEIEIFAKEDGDLVVVWDTVDKISHNYKFDNNENLVDIYW